VLALHGLRDLRGRVVGGQVDRDDGRPADLVGERAQPLLAPRDEHELPPVAPEPARRGLADPARRSCNDRHHGPGR
jgi:hypothetical protein